MYFIDSTHTLSTKYGRYHSTVSPKTSFAQLRNTENLAQSCTSPVFTIPSPTANVQY